MRLSASLGRDDRNKVEEYLTGLRELEKRIEKALPAGGGGSTSVTAQCPAGEVPPHNLPFEQHLDLMNDLIALAFRCDSTRVVTFMASQASSTRTYNFLGVSGGYHTISHHQGKEVNLDGLRKIGAWQVQKFVDLVRKLDAIDDGGGRTVLDNTLMYFSTDVSDGDRHSHWDLPMLLAGGLGGAIQRLGEHIEFADYTFPRPLVGPKGTRSMGDLFLSFLRGFGIRTAAFGDNGRNPIEEILA